MQVVHADHVRDLEDRRATLRPRRHEAALTQTRQVGAHGRLRQPEMGCQITHPMLAQRQVLQDRQPRRIGQAVELGSGHRQIPDFRYILDRRCCRYVTMLTGEDRVTFAPPPRDLLDLILTKRLTRVEFIHKGSFTSSQPVAVGGPLALDSRSTRAWSR
ncbi:hypothetical protein GCM10022275_31490 [Tessaracoccus defluvii]